MRVISLSLSLSLLCRHTSLNFFLARTGGGQSGTKKQEEKKEKIQVSSSTQTATSFST